MGKKWDYDVPSQAIWEECIRVLKPGGHLLAFAGSRTYHRMAVRIEDAGFEIRDQIMWVYGSGFPKSHNIGKAVDKIEGNEREYIGEKLTGGIKRVRPDNSGEAHPYATGQRYVPNTKGNSPYEGWGTALKPAHEPIVMARKPFKGSVAENVLEWGTGGINVDGCRVEYQSEADEKSSIPGSLNSNQKNSMFGIGEGHEHNTQGRFPANIIFECICDTTHTKSAPKSGHWPKGKTTGFGEFGGGENNYEGVGPKESGDMIIHTNPNCPCYILDQQSGKLNKQGKCKTDNKSGWQNEYVGGNEVNAVERKLYLDTGGASRFFYCPKANKKDRDEGMPESVPQFTGRPRREDGSVIYKETHAEEWVEAMSKKERKDKTSLAGAEEKLQKLNVPKQIKGRDEGQDSRSVAHKARPTARMNIHPTVKPTELMTYLIRLVTPKGGIVLDPFMGSGSTGKAAMREEFQFVGIEREKEYMEIAQQRIEWEYNKRKFF
jgi:site-specific DNA-methyltransferase (adenine-specific)